MSLDGLTKDEVTRMLAYAGPVLVAFELVKSLIVNPIKVRSASLEVEVLCAAFRIKSPGNGDGFQQCGFAAAVLTNDECYRRMQWQ